MITITTNLGQVTQKLISRYGALTKVDGPLRDKLLRTVASTVGGEMKDRIHGKGLKADGTDIGKYNTTKEIYVNPKDSPVNLKPEGKPRKVGVFKSGKKKGQDKFKGNKVRTIKRKGELFASETKHTTKYFESYEAFRKHVNRRTDKINLSLHQVGMEQDFGVVAGEPFKTRDGYGLGFKNVLNALKAEGHEKRFGKIYSLTQSEKQLVRETAEQFIKDLE